MNLHLIILIYVPPPPLILLCLLLSLYSWARHDVTMAEVIAMLNDFRYGFLWSLESERQRLWHRIATLFQRHDYPPLRAVRYVC